MNTLPTDAHHAAAQLQQCRPDFKPRVGIVLGSGLGDFAQCMNEALHIPYHELPGFPQPTVMGHSGIVSLGYVGQCAVICLQGRAHGYEGPSSHHTVKTYIRTLKLLGCDYFIATNAVGSMREDVSPGSLMLITDHINLQPSNPLVGPNDDAFGPRFLPLDQAYHPLLQQAMQQAAQQEKITLHEGIYVAVQGPNFETAAEIKAFQRLGGDVVGMSTVPEVLIANHCGLKVAVISSITNYATGLNTKAHDHNDVIATAHASVATLTRLLQRFIHNL